MRVKKKKLSLEDLVEQTSITGICLYRLKDGSNFGSIRRGKNPFDFIGSIYGIPVAIECKETVKNAIPISMLRRPQSAHQLQALLDWELAHEKNRGIYLFRIQSELFICRAQDLPKMGSVRRTSAFVKPILSIKEIHGYLHP